MATINPNELTREQIAKRFIVGVHGGAGGH